MTQTRLCSIIIAICACIALLPSVCGIFVPDWAEPHSSSSLHGFRSQAQSQGSHLDLPSLESHYRAGNIHAPHWSILRTHSEFVRLPIERRSFPASVSGSSGEVNETVTILPPRKSHGIAKRHMEQASASSRHQSKAASTDVANAAKMVGCASLDFTIPCTFGSSSVSYDLLFDTGSSTLAVAGQSCSSCTSAGVSKLYGNSGTSTGKTASGSYGDGSGWSGNIYTDTVTIKGSSGTNIGSVSMSFASMNQQTNNFFTKEYACFNDPATQSASQGIIGFGYQSLALANTDSFPMKLFNSNPSMTKSFYVEMCLYDGALWFSGMALSNYGGQFYYVPITVQEYYRITVSSITVAGTAVGGSLASVESIVDSGTTMWSIPTTQFNAITAAITANAKFKQWFGSDFFTDGLCHSRPTGVTNAMLADQLPTIGVNLNGVQITLKSVNSYLLPCDREQKTFTAGIDASSDGQIMGWAFMNSLVVHHDIANAKIGFAVQYGCQPKWDGSNTATLGSGAVITGTTASGPTGTAGIALKTFTMTRASTTMSTNSKVTLTVTPSSAPSSTVTLTMTCADSMATQAGQTLTFTSATAATLDVTSTVTPGTLTCSFALSGTDADTFAVPSSLTFQVASKPLSVTQSVTQAYSGNQVRLTLTPGIAPSSSVAVGVVCRDSAGSQTSSQSVTLTSINAVTLDVTAPTSTGTITCSFNLPTTEYVTPASITFQVFAENVLQITGDARVCINQNFPIKVGTISLTGSLDLTLSRQSSSVVVNTSVTLTTGTPLATLQVSVPSVDTYNFTLELGPNGGADAARFQFEASFLTIRAQDCSIEPLYPSSSTGGGQSQMNNAYFVVLTFGPLPTSVYDPTSESRRTDFAQNLTTALVQSLGIQSTQLNLLNVYYSKDDAPSSVSFYLTSTTTSSTSNPTYSLSQQFQVQLSDTSSAFMQTEIGASVTSNRMQECTAGSTCEDMSAEYAASTDGSESAKLFGVVLWLMLLILIGGGVILCVLLVLVIRRCRSGGSKHVLTPTHAYHNQPSPEASYSGQPFGATPSQHQPAPPTRFASNHQSVAPQPQNVYHTSYNPPYAHQPVPQYQPAPVSAPPRSSHPMYEMGRLQRSQLDPPARPSPSSNQYEPAAATDYNYNQSSNIAPPTSNAPAAGADRSRFRIMYGNGASAGRQPRRAPPPAANGGY